MEAREKNLTSESCSADTIKEQQSWHPPIKLAFG